MTFCGCALRKAMKSNKKGFSIFTSETAPASAHETVWMTALHTLLGAISSKETKRCSMNSPCSPVCGTEESQLLQPGGSSGTANVMTHSGLPQSCCTTKKI